MSNVLKPGWGCRCAICGEKIRDERFLGGRIKPRGFVFVHELCWEEEQSARKKEAAAHD